jgi:hypothetical protein
MTFGARMFLVAVVVSGLLVATGWYLSRQKLLRGRRPRTVAEILSDLPGDVRRDEASEVLQLIGKLFGVQPEILRLDDPMSKLLAMDSWRLGHGRDELERWLETKGVRQLQCRSITVREFILSVLRFNSSGQGVAG